jgi:hypothetical protein
VVVKEERIMTQTDTTTTQGIGGVPANTDNREQLDATPSPSPSPAVERYATGTEELSALVLEASRSMGRVKFAAWLSTDQHKVTPSAVWRAERNKIHPEELPFWQGVKFDEVPQPEPKSAKAKAEDRIARVAAVLATADKVSKADLVAQLSDIIK